MRRGLGLRKDSLFQRVYREGSKVVGDDLVLYYLESRDHAHTRIGFSVSKKVGGAVVRNRVKRRLRNVIEDKHARLKSGYFLVFVARSLAAERAFCELETSVEQLLEKAKILKRTT